MATELGILVAAVNAEVVVALRATEFGVLVFGVNTEVIVALEAAEIVVALSSSALHLLGEVEAHDSCEGGSVGSVGCINPSDSLALIAKCDRLVALRVLLHSELEYILHHLHAAGSDFHIHRTLFSKIRGSLTEEILLIELRTEHKVSLRHTQLVAHSAVKAFCSQSESHRGLAHRVRSHP